MQTVVETGRPPAKNLSVRGSADWLAWLSKLARHARLPVASIVDLAVVEYARRIGFDEPAPDR